MFPQNRFASATANSALPKSKPYKLTGGAGLYPEIHRNGSKYWQLKFRWGGKEKRWALELYPATFVASARLQCDQAKRELVVGFSPVETRRQRRLEGTPTNICFGLAVEEAGLSIVSAGQLYLTPAPTDAVQALLASNGGAVQC